VDQAAINAFAAISGDHAFVHVDPVQAAETAFGGTIAHGMLILSMMTGMAFEILPEVEGSAEKISYGFDRVAFRSPVYSGAEIRARFALENAIPRGRKDVMAHFNCTVGVKGDARPAVMADWNILYRF
jgi:acyl dehydratase